MTAGSPEFNGILFEKDFTVRGVVSRDVRRDLNLDPIFAGLEIGRENCDLRPI